MVNVPGVAVVDLELVAQRQLGALDHALEHAAGVHLLERHRQAPPAGRTVDRGGRRTEHAHDHAVVVGMGAPAASADRRARGGRGGRARRWRRWAWSAVCLPASA